MDFINQTHLADTGSTIITVPNIPRELEDLYLDVCCIEQGYVESINIVAIPTGEISIDSVRLIMPNGEHCSSETGRNQFRYRVCLDDCNGRILSTSSLDLCSVTISYHSNFPINA